MHQARTLALICLAATAAFIRCNAADPTLWKTDGPQSDVEVAWNGNCPLPWPPGAKNIQYVNYTGAQGRVIQLVRFEASPEFCRNYIKDWLKKWAGSIPKPPVSLRIIGAPIELGPAAKLAKQAAALDPASARPAPAGWFDSDKILHGEVWSTDAAGPGNPVFFIDTDRGILYFWLVK